MRKRDNSTHSRYALKKEFSDVFLMAFVKGKHLEMHRYQSSQVVFLSFHSEIKLLVVKKSLLYCYEAHTPTNSPFQSHAPPVSHVTFCMTIYGH